MEAEEMRIWITSSYDKQQLIAEVNKFIKGKDVVDISISLNEPECWACLVVYKVKLKVLHKCIYMEGEYTIYERDI